jgi:hypothetical protein
VGASWYLKRGTGQVGCLKTTCPITQTTRPSESVWRMASLKATLQPGTYSVRGVLETRLQKVSDFLLSGPFLHYSLVHVGYSAFAVNQSR